MNDPKRIALQMVADVTSEYMDRTNSTEHNRRQSTLYEITSITNVLMELNEIYLDISKKTFSK